MAWQERLRLSSDFVMSRRSTAPRRRVGSPPGRELLGVITSHGPSRECYTPAQKSSGRPAEALDSPTAWPALSAERVRTTLFQVLFSEWVTSGERHRQFFEQNVGFAVEHFVALQDGCLADGLSEVAFPRAARTEKQRVFTAADECRGGEVAGLLNGAFRAADRRGGPVRRRPAQRADRSGPFGAATDRERVNTSADL